MAIIERHLGILKADIVPGVVVPPGDWFLSIPNPEGQEILVTRIFLRTFAIGEDDLLATLKITHGDDPGGAGPWLVEQALSGVFNDGDGSGLGHSIKELSVPIGGQIWNSDFFLGLEVDVAAPTYEGELWVEYWGAAVRDFLGRRRRRRLAGA